MRANTPASFWARVDQSGGPEACWPWLGEVNSDGYGKVRYVRLKPNGKAFAHRIAWVLTRGSMPTQCVLHTCDNPPCCNPSHLFQGNQSDNAKQREERGRGGSNIDTNLRRLGLR